MNVRGAAGRSAAAVVALLCLTTGSTLAWQHVLAPLPPLVLLAAFLACVAVFAWRTRACWFAVPAALPALNFWPWTGWSAFEALDLLVLAAVAAAYAREAFAPPPSPTWIFANGAEPRSGSKPHALFVTAALLFGAISTVSAVAAVQAEGGFSSGKWITSGWVHGYADPQNSWRVLKSVVWAALLWRPLRREIRRDAQAAVRRLSHGMWVGVGVVALAVLWERAAYPGVWNFTLPYRTTALFWEMHVGGAAIDAYLAIGASFVVWALWTARTPGRWGLAAVLALLTTYAGLTTFSRGVYFGVAVSLLLLALGLATRHVEGRAHHAAPHASAMVAAALVAAIALSVAFEYGGAVAGGATFAVVALLSLTLVRRIAPLRRRAQASLALALILLMEVVVVLGLGTFMRDRIAASDADLGSRVEHWRQGVALMDTPADWLWGIGVGRLPSEYAARVKGGEFPGTVQFAGGERGAAEHGVVTLAGPKTRDDLKGLLALTQRVALHPGLGHALAFDVRSSSRADVHVRVCELHLLYPRTCQYGFVRVEPEPGNWRHVSMHLQGRSLSAGTALWSREAVFSIAVLNAGGVAEFDHFSLAAPDGARLLANGDFSRGMVHWLPSARGYFVPWHIDNLFLELLIERGAPATFAFVTCLGIALWRTLGGAGRTTPIAPFLAASLGGAVCVGILSSVMDVPRVALLLFLLMILAVESTEPVDAIRSAPDKHL